LFRWVRVHSNSGRYGQLLTPLRAAKCRRTPAV